MNADFRNFIRQCIEPSVCIICGGSTESSLRRRKFSLSRGLLQEKTNDAVMDRIANLLCRRCLSHLPWRFPHEDLVAPEGIHSLTCLFHYEGEIRRLMPRLKFSGDTVVAELFGLLAAYRLRGLKYSDCIILPLPLGGERRRRRGFCQTERIAEPIAAELQLSIGKNILRRNRETQPQTEMAGRQNRQINLAAAFSLQAERGDLPPTGSHLLLLDDLVTSGATLRAAVEALAPQQYLLSAICIASEAEEADLSHTQR